MNLSFNHLVITGYIMSGDTVDILKLDLYGILGVKEDATEKEV